MDNSEFESFVPIPRRGMTSVEAVRFLRNECPDVVSWMCWQPCPGRLSDGLTRLPAGSEQEGYIGKWRWRQASSDYPMLTYRRDQWDAVSAEHNWSGLIEVTAPSGDAFLLLSYLDSRGVIGEQYMVSTLDGQLLANFTKAVAAHADAERTAVKIAVVGGDDVTLDPCVSCQLFMPSGIKEDIFRQVDSFFTSAELYRRRHLPHRRGLLFVGPPGNGKTMLVREIVKHCWQEYRANAAALVPVRYSDESSLESVFGQAAANGRGIAILEEVDTLVKETQLTRAILLDRLDGLSSKTGVLVIATTNNPEDVDPALVHRPSRFDRVWHFEPPDDELRGDYLRHSIGNTDVDMLRDITQGTRGWSFAYLNELRTAAAVLAVDRREENIPPDCIRKAYELLADQYRAGKQNHANSNALSEVGFRVA